MSKLNIIEAMKMPIGTSFKVFHKIQGENCQTMIIADSHGEKVFKWSEDDMAMIREYTIDAIFIPIQQPVSFMEVVNSDKRCKVDFSEIGLPDIYKERIEKFSNKYNSFGQILFDLSNCFATRDFKLIILNSKWYIEESEELDNERLSEQH